MEVVASSADFSTLKSMRLVNKLWAEAASPEFRQRSTIVLRSGQRTREDLEKFGQATQKLQPIKAIRIIVSDQEPHHSIYRPSFHHILYQSYYTAKAKKVEEELFNNILEQYSHTLEQLELSREIPQKFFIPSE